MGFNPTLDVVADHSHQFQRLDSYAALDSARDPILDRFVFTAAQVLRVPVAAICFDVGESLLIKAIVAPPGVTLENDTVFCRAAIAAPPLLNIEDTSRDPRFSASPLVLGPPFIRFFAGAALISPDGLALGAICVLDDAPRSILPRQAWTLTQLATSIIATLEARRASKA